MKLNSQTHAEIRQRLDDYIDGALPPNDAKAVEGHLAECDDCRTEVDELRALLEDTARLPRSIEPPHDLWPAIDARLDTVPLGERSLSSLRAPLAAAAALLIAISSGLTAYLVGRNGAEEGAGAGAGAGAGVARSGAAASLAGDWQASELEYLRATAELSEALDAVKNELPAETVAMIERNLAIIDAAIQESRAALALEPRNTEMMGVLSARYREKVEVLRRVNRLTAGS